MVGDLGVPVGIVERIWTVLTDSNVACSCCDSDDEYKDRVNEIGKLIDGRTWNGRETGPRETT